MKKTLVMLMLMLGITFIYNPQTNVGFVYMNNADANYIILVDNQTNVLRFYKGVPDGEQRLDTGFNVWLQDKIDKGLPFKSTIAPFQKQLEIYDKSTGVPERTPMPKLQEKKGLIR